MSYKFQSIKLESPLDSYIVNGASDYIDGLSPINIFIGENNAGKSRFMRELAKHKNTTDFIIDSYSLQELSDAFDVFFRDFETAWNRIKSTAANTGGIPGQSRSVDMMNFDLKTYIPSSYSDSYFDDSSPNPKTLLRFLKAIQDNKLNVQSHRGDYSSAISNASVELDKPYAQEFLSTLKRFSFDKIEFDKYYIPTLRSLNNFQEYQSDKNQDIYESRIRKIYDFNDDSKVDVFTGQRIYERIKTMLLGDIELRNRIKAYEDFLSQKLFNGQEIVIIPKIDKDVVAVKIGDDERLIYELGEGIQSLIILTFPLFESEHGLFFIEEPELNMHPGMQRKFMEAIQSNPQHQYFFTTHSNHLLDLTIDYSNISIYAFRKTNDTHTVEIVTKGDKNILELIGARSSSVFLANKSIWVEGITDRLYLRRYLELYIENVVFDKQAPREDIDYMFVEYGGNNITHWSFLDATDPTINVDRITNNLMIIIDDDGDSKQERKSVLAKKLGRRYLKLDQREIENTLSPDVLIKVVSSYEPKKYKPDFDISTINEALLQSTPIGTFIEEHLFTAQSKQMHRRGGYKTDSGTIKNKLDFCHRSLEHLTYSNMSESAKKLAKKIYEFTSES